MLRTAGSGTRRRPRVGSGIRVPSVDVSLGVSPVVEVEILRVDAAQRLVKRSYPMRQVWCK